MDDGIPSMIYMAPRMELGSVRRPGVGRDGGLQFNLALGGPTVSQRSNTVITRGDSSGQARKRASGWSDHRCFDIGALTSRIHAPRPVKEGLGRSKSTTAAAQRSATALRPVEAKRKATIT